MQRPLLCLTVSFAAGILIANFWETEVGLVLLCAFLLILLMVLVAITAPRRVITFLLLVAALFLGLLRTELAPDAASSLILNHLDTRLTITGVIAQEPRFYSERSVIILHASEAEQGGWRKQIDEKIQVTVFSKNPLPYKFGDIVKVTGRVKLPDERRNPGEFDYRDYLARRGIFSTVAASEEDIVKVGEAGGLLRTIMCCVLAAKDNVKDLVDKALAPGEAGLLYAVLFGEKEYLGDSQKEVFQSLGLMHVFAVSGLHTGFVLLFLMAVTSLFRLPKLWSYLLSGCGLLFFAALSGFSPSVSRACIMAGFVLLADLCMRERDFYTSLAAAALVILFIRPGALFDAGFQLSFIATFGIVYLFPFFEELLKFLPKWRRFIIVPLAAQISVLPVVAYNFNVLSLAGVLVNIPIAAVVGAVVILGLATFIFSNILPFAGMLTAYAAGAILHEIQALLNKAADVPGVAVTVATPKFSEIAVYYMFLILSREIWLNRSKLKEFFTFSSTFSFMPFRLYLLPVFLVVSSFFIFSWPEGIFKRPDLEITFLDVGQGSSVFIKTPGGKTILLDGGGKAGDFDVGEEKILPFLAHCGIRRLDVIVSSHPHIDHLEGLVAVVKKLPVSLIVTPCAEYMYKDYYPLIREIQKENVQWSQVKGRMKLLVDPSLDITIFAPQHYLEEENINNCSLVIKMTYEKTKFLFTGDIEADRMKSMAAQFPLLESNVLLSPHHGSKLSFYRPFLEAVKPEAVVFQVGKNNSFGHPDPSVLSYWTNRGVEIYRTDLHGAIIIKSNGQVLDIKTVLRRE